MQTNVHLSIYRPFPHPSCLVQHLQFVNYKLNAAETHLRVQHTFNHSLPSSPHKIILHKSLDTKHQYQPKQINTLNTSRAIIDTRRNGNNALAVKNKISFNPNTSFNTSRLDSGRNEVIKKQEKEHSNRIGWLEESRERQQREKQKQNQTITQQKQKRTRQIDEQIQRQISIKKQKQKWNFKSQNTSTTPPLTTPPETPLQKKIQTTKSSNSSLQPADPDTIKTQAIEITRLKNQIIKINNLILRIRKDHTSEIQLLNQQLKKYQSQVQNLRQSKIKSQTSNLKNQQLNTTLFQQLQQLRTILRNQKQKSNQQRKQIHQFKKKVFQLQSINIDNLHQIEELKEIISMKDNIHNQYGFKNQELQECLNHSLKQLDEIKSEVENKNNSLKELHFDVMSVCQLLISVSNIFDKLKNFQIPNNLIRARTEIGSMKQKIINSYQQIQSLYRGEVSNRCKSNKKLTITDREPQKSINDSYKYLKTCADEDTLQPSDNSLYHMILCQATVLEDRL